MKDLETEYSALFEKFIQNLTRQYLAEVSEIMVEERSNMRQNKFSMTSFADRLKKMRESIQKKPAYKNIFKAMESVFESVDNRVIRGIKQAYSRREFPIPEVLRSKSANLKQAISENVELISGIVGKQSELLEKAVLTAVMKGSDYNTIKRAVMKQSQKGEAYAKFVAADQVAKAQAAINTERQAAAGIPGYIWDSMNDAKTRHTHRLPHGRFFLWNKTMPNDLRPRDKNGKILNPGEDYYCRCGAIPAFDQSDSKIIPKNKFDKVDELA
jgi:SPP1 gp7 family putative phage head morphogenesis protein